eukprot:810664-Rhodomonas_salina.1
MQVFSFPNKFVTKEELDANTEFSGLMLRDPTIKQWISETPEVGRAFTRLVMWHYEHTPSDPPQSVTEASADISGTEDKIIYRCVKELIAYTEKRCFMSNKDIVQVLWKGGCGNLTSAKAGSYIQKLYGQQNPAPAKLSKRMGKEVARGWTHIIPAYMLVEEEGEGKNED